MLNRIIVYLVLLSLPYTCALAQDSNKLSGYAVEVNPFAAKIIKHNIIFPPIPALSWGTDINIIRQTTGTKEWQQRRNYPVTGIGITYTDYGLNKVYGRCVGIYPVYQFYIIKGEKLEWTWRFGIGIGYVSQHHERAPSWDTINNLIGSGLNNFTMLSSDLRYHINKHFAVEIGLTATHISNGDFRAPNLGINMAGAHIGVRYSPVTSRPALQKNNLPDLRNRWLLQLRMGMGFTELGNINGPLYPVYLPSVFVSKRYQSKNKLVLGLDYAFYSSVYSFQRNHEIHPGEERKHATEMTVFIGNEFLVGRIGLLLQVGYPFKQADNYLAKYTEKLGYNFYLIKNEKGIVKELTLHSYIKAIRFKAAVIEFGGGIAL